MQRYFAESLKDNKPILSNDDIHHLLNVVRIKNDEVFEIVLAEYLYKCTLVSRQPFNFNIIEKSIIDDKGYRATLYIASTKSDKIELVLQKCTEIGIDNFIIFNSQRSVIKFTCESFDKKKDRYQKILKEASEQSKKDCIPTISFVETPSANSYDSKFIAYENASLDSINEFSKLKESKNIAFIVGPEGGFSSEEVSKYNAQGFVSISLGRNILRCETAPIYIASLISFIKGGR